MLNLKDSIMKKNYFDARVGLLSLATIAMGTLFFGSCVDGYDKESWDNGVRNQVLESPDASQIVVTPSSDGSKTTITWPVVMGAGGYICSVNNVTDPSAPIELVKDTLIDGCSITVPRAEDTNYQFLIKSAANASRNNQESETPSEVAFTSFTPTYGSIPAGSDLTEWFAANPLPDDKAGEMLCYDLVPGGEYTLSGKLDFTNHQVTLRTTNPNNPAKITYSSEDASIKSTSFFTLKNLVFDASASKSPFIELDSTPDESIKAATGKGDYYNIMGTISITGCKIDGVNNNLVYDGNKKYCVETLLINNSVIHLTSSKETSISGNAVIYFKTGYANTLTVKNSTIWNSGDSDAKYLVQYNNSGRCDRAGYTKNEIDFISCTFYNVAKAGQWGNYSGFAGRSTSYWVMTNNIFVDCGSKQICRRFLGGRGNQTTATFGNNTYMINGEFESTGGMVESYDKSGTAIEEDPQFADAANGDFHISGATQVAKKTGDPRWLPVAEENN